MFTELPSTDQADVLVSASLQSMGNMESSHEIFTLCSVQHQLLRSNLLLVDTVQTVLVISQLVPAHQRLPGEETEHLHPELDTTAHVQSGSWQPAVGTCCS